MLRVLPWITDSAIEFIEGYISHHQKSEPLKVFEFGAGNSSLWYLSKKCHVTTVDHDAGWVNTVKSTADIFGLQSQLNCIYKERPYSDLYKNESYHIVSIDGRDRVECLKRVLNEGLPKESILVLDNTERIKNGGYSEYLKELHSYKLIHFEQPYVLGLPQNQITLKDRAGLRVGHRWITTVAFHAKYDYTILGRPL